VEYRVNDMYPCIQGEGALTGTPMLLLRLQGCPVGCSFCDTKETWLAEAHDLAPDLDSALGVNPRWASVTVEQLVERARAAGLTWILVSGGEPLVQDLTDLTLGLKRYGFKLALETSGTHALTGSWDHICVSPKIDQSGGLQLYAPTIRQADEIKWVVGRDGDLDELRAFLQEYFGGRMMHRPVICVQPLSQSLKATQLCVDACLAHGYRLSVQVHKLIFPDWRTASR
jgi:7-carboxy-7-deazaguanine synthase